MLGMKLLEMGERYEDKPFPKKAFHGGDKLFSANLWEVILHGF